MAFTVLNDRDAAILRDMMEEYLSRQAGTRSRPPTELSWSEKEDHQAPEVYIAVPRSEGTGTGESEGIPALTRAEGTASYDEPGKAYCDIYHIVDDQGGDPELLQVPDLIVPVYNIMDSAVLDDWVLVQRDKFGKYVALPQSPGIVRCCLKEQHPGKGIAFEVYLGRWDPATDGWDYGDDVESATIVTAIDWWWSDTDPYPAAGATGNFEPKPSDTYGTIYHCVGNVDCDSPGSCFEGTGTGTGTGT